MRTSNMPIEPHLIRYADLVPIDVAGLDSEASDEAAAEHFSIIESDASETAAAEAIIASPHGFNLKAERRVKRGGRVGRQFASAEVLIVHAGRWRLTIGVDEASAMELGPGDVTSIPPNLICRWELFDGDVGFLFIVQGLACGIGPTARTAVQESVEGETRWLQDGRFIDYSNGIPRMR
jgi:quercetin dioxygenase-like cupin family protein